MNECYECDIHLTPDSVVCEICGDNLCEDCEDGHMEEHKYDTYVTA